MKNRISPRIQLLTIAGALAAASSILSLAAYETSKTKDLESTLTMKSGKEFGIDIQTQDFKEDETIEPGGSSTYDPYLTNTGSDRAYVFMEIIFPDSSFEIKPSKDWEPLSVKGRNIYAYVDDKGLAPLNGMEDEVPTPTSALCSAVSLKSSTELSDGSYTLHAIGYAIKVDDIANDDELTDRSPLTVWGLLDGGSQ